MVYALNGKSCYVTDNPADISPDQRALPLYTQPFPTDEALLRQALEALLGQRGEPDGYTGKQREDAIAALRERLGEKA